MKKRIRSKEYNTLTSQKLANYKNHLRRWDSDYYEETLYIKRTGEYFIHGWGGTRSKYMSCEAIKSLTLKKAKEWAKKHLDVDNYESIFENVNEETGINESRQLFSLHLPVVMLEELRARKEKTGINLSSLIIKSLRDAGY